MDEITLFAELQPPPPHDTDEIRAGARTRLAGALGETGTRTGAVPAARPRHRRRAVLGLTAAAAAAGAAIVAPIVAPSGGATAFATADYSVQPTSNGTFTVTIKQLRDPAGLQRALRADGIAAYVRYVPLNSTCYFQQDGGPKPDESLLPEITSPRTTHDGPNTMFVIRPAKLPAGDALLIGSYQSLSMPGKAVGNVGPAIAVATVSLMGNDRPPVCGPPPPGKQS